jgi:hypothetical protein
MNLRQFNTSRNFTTSFLKIQFGITTQYTLLPQVVAY